MFQYTGTAETSGYKIGIYFYVAETYHETDYVTLVALYPPSLVEDEHDRVLDLMDSVE